MTQAVEERRNAVTIYQVRVLSNGFVDSYAVTWPGGGISGLTYDASCSVATRKALEMGIPLLYETKSGQQ